MCPFLSHVGPYRCLERGLILKGPLASPELLSIDRSHCVLYESCWKFRNNTSETVAELFPVLARDEMVSGQCA